MKTSTILITEDHIKEAIFNLASNQQTGSKFSEKMLEAQKSGSSAYFKVDGKNIEMKRISNVNIKIAGAKKVG